MTCRPTSHVLRRRRKRRRRRRRKRRWKGGEAGRK